MSQRLIKVFSFKERSRRARYLLFLFPLLVFCSCWSHAQTIQAEAYTWEWYTTADGLSQSHVYDLGQDDKGIIWLATRDGLNMFDGMEFCVFHHKPGDEGTIRNNSIDCMAIAPDGSVWCSVGNLGVDSYDRDSGIWKHYPLVDNRTGKRQVEKIRDMEFDNSGRLWVCTEHGIYLLNRERQCLHTLHATEYANDNIDTKFFVDIFMGRDGMLWFTGDFNAIFSLKAGETGFKALSKQKFPNRIVGHTQDGKLQFSRRLLKDFSGHIDFFTIDLASQQSSLTALKLLDAPPPLQLPGFYDLIGISPDNDIWLHARNPFGVEEFNPGGIYKIDGNSGRVLAAIDQSWPSTMVFNSILFGTNGIIWIGTNNGLIKLVPQLKRFENLQYKEDGSGLSHNVIRDILIDRRGDYWVGTDFGLNHIESSSGKIRQILRNDFNSEFLQILGDNVSNEIYEEEDGTLLVGMNYGLFQVDSSAGELKLIDYDKHKVVRGPRQSIWSLARDDHGRLWIGTRHRGIYVMDSTRRFVTHFHQDSLRQSEFRGGIVWEMVKGPMGDIWAATASGVYRFDPSNFSCTSYRDPINPRSPSSSNVVSLTRDDAGDFWFTTNGFGIMRYSRALDSFMIFDSRSGLAVDLLYGMVQDGSGNFWGSSNDGLLRFDPETGSSRFYSQGDGLASNEFSFKAYARAPDGRLLFGGVNGLTMFYPDSLHDNQFVPPVSIIAFNIMDGPERILPLSDQTLVVDHAQKLLRFRFAALDYVNPELNQYAYKLEGFDEDWVYCGTRREAVFTNLDPGEYVFRVRGSNNDGYWNEAGTSVRLSVVPPFWMTWWFWLVVVLVLGGLAAWIVAGRVRLLLARKTLRQRVLEYRLQTLRLQMNPHFIFNLLSSIESLIIKRREREAVESLSSFARLVRGVLDSSRSSTVPIAEELAHLRVYLELEHLRHNAGFDYEIDVSPDIHQLSDSIPSMLIQPYVENAIKHGLIHTVAQGRVSVCLRREGDGIHCVIEDNGIGRVAAQQRQKNSQEVYYGPGKSSLGMSVSRERLNLLNSTLSEQVTCRVEDLTDLHGKAKGTRISLYIPVKHYTYVEQEVSP